MHLVLIHLGKSKVDHIHDCIKQIKSLSQVTIHVISESRIDGVNWEDSIQYQNDPLCNWFRTPANFLGALGDLWNYSLQRFFVLYLYCKRHNLNSIFHIENDQLLFYDPLSIEEELKKINQPMIIDLGGKYATAALSYFKDLDTLKRTIDNLQNIMNNGGEWIKKDLGMCSIEVPGEMGILKCLLKNNLISTFPTMPGHQTIGGYLFDPASYGQTFFGTPQGHSAGCLFEHHYIGAELLRTGIRPVMVNDKPFIENIPIFNLHMHNKIKMKDFM